jgi:hypothetical protein
METCCCYSAAVPFPIHSLNKQTCYILPRTVACTCSLPPFLLWLICSLCLCLLILMVFLFLILLHDAFLSTSLTSFDCSVYTLSQMVRRCLAERQSGACCNSPSVCLPFVRHLL